MSQCQNSDNQAVRQLVGVGAQCQMPAPLEIVQQPRSRESLLPETDGVPHPPPVALPRVVSDS